MSRIKQRIAIAAIAVTATFGVVPVATAAPAEAYTIIARMCASNGPYLACTKLCKVDYNWWEEVFLSKYDGWKNCGRI